MTPSREPRRADQAALDEAAARLRAGETVAFPTETVYGLGADAANAKGVAAIYAIKGRPAGHPLIVHVLDRARAARWAALDARAQRLIDAFWPGPLTLILRRLPQAPAHACGAESTIGLRCPSHPVAQALLQAFLQAGGEGIAAPSANRFGRVSPTRAEHVIEDLGDQAPMVLEGGPSEVGVESTIVDLSREHAVLLRPGRVGRGEIEAALGEALRAPDAAAPRAPGTLAAHYAPATPLELVDADRLAARIAELTARGERVATWSREAPRASSDSVTWQPAPATPSRYEHELYDALRKLDRSGAARILVEAPPADRDWEAVADRLRRAATGSAQPPAAPGDAT